MQPPAPAPIMAVFESVGTLTGLEVTASFQPSDGAARSAFEAPVAARFEGMPKWYRCEDS